MEQKLVSRVSDNHLLFVLPIDEKLRHKQPFKTLQAYVAIATVFSYYGWKDEVYQLLQKLSKTSRAYFAEHRPILGGFLKPLLIPRELKCLG